MLSLSESITIKLNESKYSFDTYEQYKELKKTQDDIVTELSKKLNSYPKGSGGIIPSDIRNTDDFKNTKLQYDIEFKKLQNINVFGSKKFKKEMSAERENMRMLRQKTQ